MFLNQSVVPKDRVKIQNGVYAFKKRVQSGTVARKVMGFSEEHTIILLNRHSIHSIRLTPNDLLNPQISALSLQWENSFSVDSD